MSSAKRTLKAGFDVGVEVSQLVDVVGINRISGSCGIRGGAFYGKSRDRVEVATVRRMSATGVDERRSGSVGGRGSNIDYLQQEKTTSTTRVRNKQNKERAHERVRRLRTMLVATVAFRGCEDDGVRLIEVDHGDGTTLLAVRPHGATPAGASSASHAEFGDLRAVLTVMLERRAKSAAADKADGLRRLERVGVHVHRR